MLFVMLLSGTVVTKGRLTRLLDLLQVNYQITRLGIVRINPDNSISYIAKYENQLWSNIPLIP